MPSIKSFNGRLTITGNKFASEYDKDILAYAANNYSYVNGVGQYDISINEWIKNIRNSYDDEQLQVKEIIRVLMKL